MPTVILSAAKDLGAEVVAFAISSYDFHRLVEILPRSAPQDDTQRRNARLGVEHRGGLVNIPSSVG